MPFPPIIPRRRRAGELLNDKGKALEEAGWKMLGALDERIELAEPPILVAYGELLSALTGLNEEVG